MRTMMRLAVACVALAATSVLGMAWSSDDGPRDTAALVRRALARVPYYGVFDFLAFKVDHGAVTLQGYAHRPALKSEAEEMVHRAVALDVANQIEVLPTATLDDRIRWDVYRRVYTEDFSDKYISGGSATVRYELFDMARFPGMEPYGNYPIHIIVKGRRVALIGAVANAFDKDALLIRAKQAAHTTGVDDLVMVRTRS